MRKAVIFGWCMALGWLCASAQDDVSEYLMTGNGFDTNFNYDPETTGNVKGDVINEVYGWTNETTATYTVAGSFAWNPNVTFNDSKAFPSAGYNGSTGGCLGLTTGWGMELVYTQTVTLPKGTYKLTSAYYNVGSSSQNGTSLLGWIPASGTAVASKVTRFPISEWVTDELEFTLTQTTTGKIRIGIKTSESTGSASHPKLLVDYVKLLCSQVDKGELKNALDRANAVYRPNASYAKELKAAIDAAQAVYSNNAARPGDIFKHTRALAQATRAYQYKNATASNPLDVTSFIANNSFEDNGATGWDNRGMAAQGNKTFPGVEGATYMERWTSIGNHVPNVGISQTLTDIPDGRYRLTAASGAIQQTGSGSTVNNGDPQVGAYIFAGYYQTPVTVMKSGYTQEFSVVDGQVTLGFKTEGCTANWVCFDNATLQYMGANTVAQNAEYLNHHIAYIVELMVAKPIQNSVRSDVEATLAGVTNLIKSGNTDEAKTQEAKQQLDEAEAKVLASARVVGKLVSAIDYAKQVREWYKDDSAKVAILDPSIAAAQASLANMDQTDEQIAAAVKTLNDEVAKVDKKVYTAQWSMGNVNDPNNSYYIGRTRQGKDWILFWEKGYGEEPESFVCGNYTADVDGIMEHAQIAFDYYSDVLKFIDRATSKTNKYKMVIRLRYEPTEWEATGSGVDDLIGLLTLTPWAAPSRNWQTLYHEVGHCFQYQVHCDNGDQNGFMYNPGDGKGCGFWEQCAQWQAYKIMPQDQFSNEWFDGYLSNSHKHILADAPRYNNFFIQDYWCYRHGKDFLGKLWNQSKRPEDPAQAYMRITGITIPVFYDEMYDCAARFATWDIPELREYGEAKVDSRPLPSMRKLTDGSWRIMAANVPENTGYNVIRLNVPEGDARNVQVRFQGLNRQSGFNVIKPETAEWRYGFVAWKEDGERVYGDMSKATYAAPDGFANFEVPENTKRLYLVVSGGSTEYAAKAWDDDTSNDEQWPYAVLFGNTNRYGAENNPALSGVMTVGSDVKIPAMIAADGRLTIAASDEPLTVSVYSLAGTCVGNATLESGAEFDLPQGFYVVRIVDGDGHEIVVRKIIL